MMTRTEILEVIAGLRTNEIVVYTMSMVKDWPRLSPSSLNFQVAGAMGFASSVGLGLAIARPDKRVIVLDGDGSLLMNLGTLVTIASQSPANLLHLVFENGLYELPGQVPLPGAGTTSILGIARAAGLGKSCEIDNLADFRDRIGGFLSERGPTFVCLKVASGPKAPLTKASDSALARAMEKALRS